ncbi:hypothetical protein [Fischerella major]|uniref:hypothetical protein n=1 Tax=Fischerella major TaxID=210993 RepID=UPI0015B8FF56|nr:hypothetical protein [Fischerella major]
MARSIWQENTDWSQFLSTGVNANSEGLFIPVLQDCLSRQNPNLPVCALTFR